MAAFKSVHFSKNLVVRSSAGPNILAFGRHCSANFQPILDYFMPNFKLKYEDSENIKADRLSTVVFNLHQIKRRAFFWGGHPVYIIRCPLLKFQPIFSQVKYRRTRKVSISISKEGT